jgi:hypothetical protein
MAAHVYKVHPSVLSLQIFRQTWGPNPRRAYLWLEEYASLSALESEPENPDCVTVWTPVEDMALEGTYVSSLWTDPNRSLWFNR